MAFLQFNQLQKTYSDGTPAVKGIDLACEAGEFIVLLGPSGCGKTTTLRMIAGLEIPTAGQIMVDGHDITNLPPHQRDVGFVFQFYALYPHMTVQENITFPLNCAGLDARTCRQRVEAILTRLGLKALAHKYPENLSGGDQQRVALGRAMVRQPQLYLMDEPLGTLDSDLRLEMRELIKEQQLALGITTIYVTHDQEEAMSLADKVVVMEGGRIRQNGPPALVYDEPQDLFVAHFIGSPGMNFIEGEIRSDKFGCSFVRNDWSINIKRQLTPGKVKLGIRPEYVHLGSKDGIPGTIIVDEYLGAWHNIHIETAIGRLVLRTDAEGRYKAGTTVEIDFDPQHIQFFATDGDRL